MSDLSIQWLIVFVDASVKAALVALVAAAGLALMRVRDSNLRHRVWMGVLCGMLLLPALTQIVPALRLPITVNPDWFAVLNPTEVADESAADLSSQATQAASASGLPDRQPDALDSQPLAADDGRAMDAQTNWPGAGRRGPGNMSSDSLPSRDPSGDALADDSPSQPTPVAANAPVEPEPAVASRPATVPPTVWQILLSHLPFTFWSLWLAGALILTLRLGAGLWTARALRRSSRPIASSALPAALVTCGAGVPPAESQARRLHHNQGEPQLPTRKAPRNVPVLACPLIRVPLTLGVFRPQILLPPDWIDWSPEKLHAVLVHERTHAERGDCALAMLAEVNRCLYWFHPLAWWLRRHLASLAEAACDDAAIGSTGDRTSYARHLLEVAATARAHRGRLVIGGVSMARCSSVESRIDTILDFTRPLSRRLTWATTLALLGIIAPLIALTAALRPSSGTGEAQSVAANTQNLPSDTVEDEAESTAAARAESVPSTEYSALSTQPSSQDKRAFTPDADVTFTFAGTVVGPDGLPVTGARVVLSYLRVDGAAEPPPAGAVSDGSGRFEFSVKKSSISAAIDKWAWSAVGVVAAKDGYGFDYLPAGYVDTTGRFDAELPQAHRAGIERKAGERRNVLKLAVDDVPIKGRVVDIEGGPVAGARVDVVSVLAGNDGTLDGWEAAAGQKDADYLSMINTWPIRPLAEGYLEAGRFYSFGAGLDGSPAGRAYNWPQLLFGSRAAIVPTTNTDADGRFTVKGLGRERIAEFVVSAPGIETTQQFFRSRPGEVVQLPGNRLGNSSVATFYPSEFTVVVGPGAVVEGRVVDKASRRALAGVRVQSTNQLLARSISDADGRYRLAGMRLGGSTLIVTPPVGSRHLSGGLRVKPAAGAEPLSRDIVLTEGVLVRGRATDERTGEPVRGRVDYYAYETNPERQQTDSLFPTGSRDRHGIEIDAAGRFEFPVLPGKGILGFNAGGEFQLGLGIDTIDCPKISGKNYLQFVTSPISCPASSLNLVVAIDPQSDEKELAVNAMLRSVPDIPGRVLSPDGRPLTDYDIDGTRVRNVWPKNEGETFTVKGYTPAEQRWLLVYHREMDLAGYYLLEGQPPEKVDINLRPAATFVGRILDEEGMPLEIPQIDADVTAPGTAVQSAGMRALPFDEDAAGHSQIPHSDASGRFKLRGIVPGLKYTAIVHLPTRRPTGKFTIFVDATAEPGEIKDLGDLRPAAVKPDVANMPEKSNDDAVGKADGKPKDEPKGTNGAAAAGSAKARAVGAPNSVLSTEYSVLSTQSPAQAKSETKPGADVTYSFAGTVVGPEGQPIAGAKISLSYFHKSPQPPSATTAAIADQRGKFEFSMKRSDFVGAISGASWFRFDAGLVAEKEGYGFAYAPATFFETTGRLDGGLSDYQRESIERQGGKKTDVLMLVRDDVPIHGRILNADGRPVAGASVEAFEFWEGKDGTLDAWDAATKGQEASSSSAMRHLREILRGHWMTFNWTDRMGTAPARLDVNQGNLFTGTRPPIVPAVRTDANGWFTLKGVGRERIAEVLISGPGVETTQQRVRSRPGEVVKLGLHEPAPHSDVTLVYYPSEFTLVSGPSVPVTGHVTDAKTGQPLAGVGIQSTEQFRGAVTDKAGKYRLEGLPLGANSLFVTPPAGSRHLAGGVIVTTAAAAPPLVRDITLMPGVWVRGRAIDETTGKPLRGTLEYFAYETNAQKTESDSLRLPNIRSEFHPDAGGRFEIPVLPGPGIVGFNAGQEFPDAVGAEQIDGPMHEDAGNAPIFNTVPRWCDARSHNLVVAVNPKPEDDELIVNLTLRSGLTVPVRVLAPDGQPLSGYRVFGSRRHWVWPVNPGETFRVLGYSPTETRRLMVYHEGRDLVGHFDLKGEPPKEIVITLQPAATIVGRVLDADGPAFEHADIWDLRYNAFLNGKPSADDLTHGVLQMNAKTDSQGRFQLKGIVPGLQYTAHLNFFRDPSEKELNTSLQGPIFVDVTAEPGQTKDLGDLRLELDSGKPATTVKAEKANSEKPAAKPALDPAANEGKKSAPTAAAGNPKDGSPAAKGAAASGPAKASIPSAEYSVLSTQSPAQNNSESGKSKSRTLRGRVVDSSGKPLAGVVLKFPVLTKSKSPAQKDDATLVSKGTTDADGRFVVDFSDDDFARWGLGWHSLPLIALHSEFAIEWVDIPKEGDLPAGEIVLYPEQVIRGKMIDAEGRPVPGAKVAARYLHAPRTGNSLDVILAERQKLRADLRNNIRYLDSDFLPESFSTAADGQGQFELHGLAAERICEVSITAPDFATTTLLVANRQDLDVAPYNQPRRGMFARGLDRLVGPTFTHVGVPDFKIEGRVTAPGGKPLASLRVGAAFMGSEFTSTVTDAEGRYHLSGLPRGGRLAVLIAVQDYDDLLQRTVQFTPTADEASKIVDVELKRGILVSGRVVDALTGQGAFAQIHYFALPGNDYINKPEYEDGRALLGRVDAEGRFRFVVIPGPGALVVEQAQVREGAVFRTGVVSEADSEYIKVRDQGVVGRTFAAAIGQLGVGQSNLLKYVNFAEDAGPQTVDLLLDRGKAVELELADADGQPVAGAAVMGVWDTPGERPTRIKESRTTIYGLSAERRRKVIAVQEERNLSATVLLTGDEPSPVSLKLEKAASVRGRAVDEHGEPLSRAAFSPVIQVQIQDFLNSGKPRLGTDDKGHFHLKNLVPGEPFRLSLNLDGKLLVAKMTPEQRMLKPGQDVDLGDVVFTAPNRQLQSQNDAAKPANNSVLSTQDSVPSNDGPSATSQTSPPKPLDSSPKPAATRTIRGRVLDAKGQPLAGVSLYLAVLEPMNSVGQSDVSLVAKGANADDGQFVIPISEDDVKDPHGLPKRPTQVVAQHPGYGVEWFDLPDQGDVSAADIVLTPEQLIRGRMIDAEGRAVAGANITVEALTAPQSGNSVDPLLDERKGGRFPFPQVPRRTTYRLPKSDVAVTDRAGQFEIRGVAAERLCKVRIAGDNFAIATVTVANRQGLDPALFNPTARPGAPRIFDRLVGPDFTHVGAPGLVVDGRVTSPEGQPVAGLRIMALRVRPAVYATTDADGRYRLAGLPRGGEFMIRFGLLDHASLLSQIASVSTTPDESHKSIDAALIRGVVLAGRVLDRATGKGVSRAGFQFVPLAGNAYMDQPGYEGMRLGGLQGYADLEGKFQIVAFPGPAALIVNEVGTATKIDELSTSPFRPGYVTKEDEAKLKITSLPGGERGLQTFTGLMSVTRSHAVKYVELAEDGSSPKIDVELDRGMVVELNIVDADGQPVTEAFAAGLDGNALRTFRLRESRVMLYGLDAEHPRKVVAMHTARRLAGSLTLTGDESGPVRLILDKSASIRGRAVDEFKAPLAAVSLGIPSPAAELFNLEHEGRQPATDNEGRFRIDNLLPEERFGIIMRLESRFLTAKLTEEQRMLKPGQDVDLGDVVFTPPNQQQPQQNEAKKPGDEPNGKDGAANSPSDKPVAPKVEIPKAANSVLSTEYSGAGAESSPAQTKSETKPRADAAKQTDASSLKTQDSSPKPAASRTIRGRVVDSKGSPIAGVALEIPGALLNRGPPPVGKPADGPKATSDADGHFALEAPDNRRLPLIASHDGFAVELFDVPEQGDVAKAEIVLQPEQPIHGRMIDAEGRPVAGARIFVGQRLATGRVKSVDEYLEARKKNQPGQPVETRFLMPGFMPQSYLATSDAEGRFVIRGIAADGACGLQITADRFVTSRLVVVNRQGLDPAPYNQQNQPGGPRRPASDRLVGPEFNHVGVPAITIEGRATVDGKPAADVIVRASANLMVAGVTTTDADGRYKLAGLPRGGELRVIFGGPERQSDLLSHSVTVATTPEDTQKTVDVELKRASSENGTLLTGHVIDPSTGKGVPAFVRFVPLAGNEFADQPAYKDLKSGGTQVRANPEGAFRVPVIPGPGALLVQVNGTIRIGRQMFSPFRLGCVSEDDKPKLKITGERGAGQFIPTADGKGAAILFKCAIKYINLAEGGEPKPVEITLDRGKTLELDIVDGEGQPVAGAALVGIEELDQATRLGESRTTIYALSSETPRTVFVLHGQRGLAGSLKLTGDEPSPVRMTLGKSASIRGRAVDKSGEPIAEAAYDIFSTAAYQLFELDNAGRPQTMTDKKGRFQFGNIIPGERFSFNIRLDDKFLIAKLTDDQQTLKSGQELDLGDVVFTAPNQQQPQPNETKKPGEEPKGRTAP